MLSILERQRLADLTKFLAAVNSSPAKAVSSGSHTESAAPRIDPIREQFLALITAGLLSADQRPPSVRQLASDLA